MSSILFENFLISLLFNSFFVIKERVFYFQENENRVVKS